MILKWLHQRQFFSDKVISMNDKVNKLKKLNHFKKFKIDKN